MQFDSAWENIYGVYLKQFDDGFESITFLIGSKNNILNINST
jgi:hypothetical protein